MLNLFIRCIILYFFLLLAMRLMGKRQLGELQPFELAITLVASELVCIPMADASIPILYGIIPVFSLFLVHILITKLATKSVRFRKFLNGKPVIVIEKGNILPEVLKELNMNIDDIMEALRGEGYFNPSEVEYAILETNGNMSVMPKSQNKPLSPMDMNISTQEAEIPVTVIMEGEFIGENIARLDATAKERVLKYLTNIGLRPEDVLVLLMAGTDVYIQPYHAQFISAQLENDEDTQTSVSITQQKPQQNSVIDGTNIECDEMSDADIMKSNDSNSEDDEL